MAPVKVILDTDPGIDDVHAILLALAAQPEELELLMISVSWGNVDVKRCLRNTISVFHVVQKEIEWRQQHGRPKGFRALEQSRPIIAVGASSPLDGQEKSADYYHGIDGLGGVHIRFPHLTASEAWERLFEQPPPDSSVTSEAKAATDGAVTINPLFTPTLEPAHLEMLKLLANNPPDTIDIVAVGPLTTVAQAAAADPVTFLRARRLVIMGGAINIPGNITPLGEFNFVADPVAAARVLALSAPIPASTTPHLDPSGLPAYPALSKLGDRRLDIILWPVDVTEEHVTPKDLYLKYTEPLTKEGSPLAQWTSHLFTNTLEKRAKLHRNVPGVTFHDPLCIWYVMCEAREPKEWQLSEPVDMRVEPGGQWTRGSCIVDKRDRIRQEEPEINAESLPEVIGDSGGWLSMRRGNRIRWCTKTPGGTAFAETMLGAFFSGK